MKQVLFLFAIISLLLSSCAPHSTPQIVPTRSSTAIEIQPITTVPPATATFTPAPPTPSSTPEICDPFQADFCIVDGHLILQRPIQPPANTFVDYTYPYASDFHNTREPHHGVEFLNKFGTPVFAAGDGVVIFAGSDENGQYSGMPNFYGNLVVIRHTADLFTLYAHLSKIQVQVSQQVTAGDQIGEVGQTGSATGSHLHFEVRQGDVVDYFSTQNPELWLVPNLGANGQPMGAVEATILDKDGELVRFAEINLQQYDAQNRPIGNTYYRVSYPDRMLMGQENFAMNDLPAGRYRLVVNYMGWYHERWLEVKSGRLTQVVITVN